MSLARLLLISGSDRSFPPRPPRYLLYREALREVLDQL